MSVNVGAAPVSPIWDTHFVRAFDGTSFIHLFIYKLNINGESQKHCSFGRFRLGRI